MNFDPEIIRTIRATFYGEKIRIEQVLLDAPKRRHGVRIGRVLLRFEDEEAARRTYDTNASMYKRVAHRLGIDLL
jgi:hypothetical protein